MRLTDTIHYVSILNFGETKIMYRRKQSTRHHRLQWSQTKGGLFNRGACYTGHDSLKQRSFFLISLIS